MTATAEKQITIKIPDREALIKAIAAAMRWKAHVRSDTEGDDENQLRLARLIEQLVLLEDSIVE